MYTYVSSLAVFCTYTATCLAPNLVVRSRLSFPDVISKTTTNTSVEVQWTMPTLSECCTDVVFSYPLVRYGYGVNPDFFEPEVSCTFTVCRVIIIIHICICPGSLRLKVPIAVGFKAYNHSIKC